jgi:hypothetical protein
MSDQHMVPFYVQYSTKSSVSGSEKSKKRLKIMVRNKKILRVTCSCEGPQASLENKAVMEINKETVAIFHPKNLDPDSEKKFLNSIQFNSTDFLFDFLYWIQTG